ncbi:MAG: response regulator [Natronospirillum sp.]
MAHTIAAADLSLLLIEPSEVQQKIIVRSLQELGIRKIETATTFATARDIILSTHPDLVVSAMYLEDGTAEDFLTSLRKDPATEGQPFMLVSSERNKHYLETMRQSGVLAILPKPFGAESLDRAIRATIDSISEEELDLEVFDIHEMRILLVDDSRMARKHIRRTLEKMGASTFVEAENGKQAVQLLLQEPFDVIFTDYNMPEMDGRELTEFVRQQPALSHLPILMVSSEANETQLSNIAQSGVDAICEKPFEPATIRSLLQRLLS